MLVVIVGWVLFRADNFGFSLKYIATMFGIGGEKDVVFTIPYYMRNTEWIIMIAALICSMPIFEGLLEKANNKWKLLLLNTWLIVLFILSYTFMASSTYQPFLYFKF